MNSTNNIENTSKVQSKSAVANNDSQAQISDLKYRQILQEDLKLTSTADILKKPLKDFSIEGYDLASYSISFTFIMHNKPESIMKVDQVVFFQIGVNTMKKDVIIGINSDLTIFVSLSTKKGKFENLFSQMRVKQNTAYSFAFCLKESKNFVDLWLYVNGQVESQISMANNLETPRGYFFFGSESSTKCFKGVVKDCFVFFPCITSSHVREIHFSQKTQDAFNRVPLASEQLLESQLNFSKKTGVPISIVRSFVGDSLSVSTLRQSIMTADDGDPNQSPARKRQKYVIQLRQALVQRTDLMERCRSFSFNFEWIFNTLYTLSPPIEEGGPAMPVPFECLQKKLLEEKVQTFPMYAIELDRFLKVTKHLDMNLSPDEVEEIGSITHSFKRSKRLGKFIFYDKFLIAIRNACLTREEIRMLKKINKLDDLNEEAAAEHEQQKADDKAGVVSYGKFLAQEVSIGFDCSFQLQDSIENMRPYSITCKTASESEIFPTQEEISFVFKNVAENNETNPYTFSFENKRNLESESYSSKQTIQFEDKEEIKKIVIKFDKATKFVVSINFHTNQGKNYFLGFAQISAYASSDSQSTEEVIELLENERVLSFFGHYIQKGGKNYLGGLGIHVYREPLKPEEVENFDYFKEDEELPAPPNNWNQGKFQLIVNYCNNCDKHKGTTWHEEADFAEKFNELGMKIKDLFPNADIIGNWDEQTQYENFDVYIRGVGPFQERDNEGRFYFYRKCGSMKLFLDEKEFDRKMLKVYDGICLLIAAYGNAIELEKAQEAFLSTFSDSYPPRSKIAQDYPANVPERESKKKEQHSLENGTIMQCRNWGCGQQYPYDDNPTNTTQKCRYHPGKYEFGSINGLWPESWTCCRGEWLAPGCRRGKHRGVPAKKVFRLCINHGDINPKTKRPDSACGKCFPEEDPGECKYHSGYLANEKWSCCGQADPCEPCLNTGHVHAEWPDERAKLYFIHKKPQNPGLNRDIKEPLYEKTARFSGFYVETKQYKIFINRERALKKREIETENDLRYCLRWACETTYKEVENRKAKTCVHHPGTWDFGYTGVTVSKACENYGKPIDTKDRDKNKMLWRPHWTCCRKEKWDEPGCVKGFHRGPLASEMPERKYKWPSEQAMKYLGKRVSDFWLKKLGTEKYSREKMNLIWDICVKQLGSGGSIPSYKLPMLCDKFKLHLLVISDDLSYHFKYMDVVEGKAQNFLSDNNGGIDKKKFMSWWFSESDRSE